MNVIFWVGVKSNNPLLNEKHGNFDYFKYLIRLAPKPEFETMTCDVILRDCPKHIQEQLKQNNYNFEVI